MKIDLEIFVFSIHDIGIIVLVDFQASRLQALANEGEKNFNHALVMYTLYVTAGVVLMILSTLCMFFILINAAYKVGKILVFE